MRSVQYDMTTQRDRVREAEKENNRESEREIPKCTQPK